MKKLFNRPMKVLFCFLVMFSTFVISAPPAHASEWIDGVELNVEKEFGRSSMKDWNGCIYWEQGTYEVTGLTSDTYDVTLRYYFHVDSKNSKTEGPGYSYQYIPVHASIDGEWLAEFDKTGTNYYHGDYLWGTAKKSGVPRGRPIEYRLYDNATEDQYHTALNIINDVEIGLPVYTVNFWSGYSPIAYEQQRVVRHQNASKPDPDPSATGYQFTGWDKGFTNITSDLNVYAKWNRLNPEIKARESAYKIGDRVDLWKLQTNSKADDTRQGNITGRVEIISDVVHNGQLDTSTKGIYDVTYKVTNDDDLHLDQPKSAEKHTKIHIVDPNDPLVDINLTDENIYSRYISGNEMMNGQRPVNDLKPYSIWSRTGLPNMWNILNNSLNRRTPLFTIDGVHGQ